MEPTYPKFDGSQNCVGIDVNMFYADAITRDQKDEVEQVKSICGRCSYQVECLNWALHFEKYGIWGGTTGKERKFIRRERGIRLKEREILLQL